MNIEKMLSECRAHWEKTKPDAVFPDYWLGWQASRESLVIELPSDQCIDIHGYSPKAVKQYCRKSIEASGLKVKS